VPAISRRQAAVGTNWVHERNHDGFRLMARVSPVGIRLRLARFNHFPLIVEVVKFRLSFAARPSEKIQREEPTSSRTA
jgi:hypothetical protein